MDGSRAHNSQLLPQHSKAMPPPRCCCLSLHIACGARLQSRRRSQQPRLVCAMVWPQLCSINSSTSWQHSTMLHCTALAALSLFRWARARGAALRLLLPRRRVAARFATEVAAATRQLCDAASIVQGSSDWAPPLPACMLIPSVLRWLS